MQDSIKISGQKHESEQDLHPLIYIIKSQTAIHEQQGVTDAKVCSTNINRYLNLLAIPSSADSLFH